MASAVVFAALLYASRRFDFFYDEWDFVLAAPHRTLADHFVPHNGHWVTLAALAYTALLSLFGARSHLPFTVVLLLLHAAAALLLFRIVSRRAGDLPALLSAVVLLVLSRGWENLLWAFQMNFGASVVAGLLAIDLLDRAEASWARVAMASTALLASLMSSGIGLVFFGAVAVDVLLDRRRRPYAAALVAPALAYAIWFLSFGRSGAPGSWLSAAGLVALIGYVPTGVGAVAAALVGLGRRWSHVALATLAAVMAVSWTRTPGLLDTRALGALAGLVGLFVLTGLTRWQLGDAQAASARYVYVGAVFLLLLLAGVLRELPWRGFFRLAPLLLVPVVAFNAIQLAIIAANREREIRTQSAILRTVWLFRDAPGLDRSAVVDRTLSPQIRASAYIANRVLLGSPLPETTIEDLGRLPASAVNGAAASVLPLRISPAPPDPAGARCASVDPATGHVDVAGPSGSTVLVRSIHPGALELSWWLVGPGPGELAVRQAMAPATALAVDLPDAGPGVQWHLRVRPPPDALVCGPTPRR